MAYRDMAGTLTAKNMKRASSTVIDIAGGTISESSAGLLVVKFGKS